MRELYESERKTISMIDRIKWGRKCLDFPKIISEYHGPLRAKAKTQFNLDFEYKFYFGDYPCEEKAKAVTAILPNTLGAELYYFVYEDSHLPIILTLMGGEAFPIKHYKKYIDEIETVLTSALSSCNEWQPFSEQVISDFENKVLNPEVLLKRKTITKNRYLRVMVIYDVICFLTFTNDEKPAQRGTRYRLIEDDKKCIDCYVDGNDLLCFDGWMTTAPCEKSEWVLYSEREP